MREVARSAPISSEQLDSLRGRLTPTTFNLTDQLRRQRNALFRDGALIRDLRAWDAQCRRVIANIGSSPASRPRGGSRIAPPRAPACSPLRGVSVVVAVAALGGLGLVAFAWFDAAAVCAGNPDRLGCTFASAGYLPPALAAVAIAAAGVLSAMFRRRKR